MSKKIESLAIRLSVAVFVAVLLVLTLAVENLTPTEYRVLHILLALAAAGVGALVPGVSSADTTRGLRGAGALGIFALVYVTFPKIVTAPNSGGISTSPLTSAKWSLDVGEAIMDPVTLSALIGAAATVAAAVIAKNWGERRGARQERQQWVQALSSAPSEYANRLSDLIDGANAAPDSEIVIHARAIVSARNDLRDSLINLSTLLNSDIDRLSSDVSSAPEADRIGSVRSTISVLKLKWPSKKEQVAVELRKVLAELGLERRANSRT